jgi:hypothetical protein
MSFLNNVRNILPSISWLLGPPPPTGPFTPTYGDVCQTRALLKSLKLPTELVLSILEHAQYWPRHEISGGGAQAAALRNRPSAATLCLSINVFDTLAVQDALASGEHAKLRKIEFRVQSRDQGWTTERTQGFRRLHGQRFRFCAMRAMPTRDFFLRGSRIRRSVPHRITITTWSAAVGRS